MTNKYTLLLALLLGAAPVFGQRIGQDEVADWRNINIKAAGLLTKNGGHKASILVTDSGAVFADKDVVCRGIWIDQDTEYISLGFECASEWPSQYEYLYTTWDENKTKFDVYRAIGYHRVKLYMLNEDF